MKKTAFNVGSFGKHVGVGAGLGAAGGAAVHVLDPDRKKRAPGTLFNRMAGGAVLGAAGGAYVHHTGKAAKRPSEPYYRRPGPGSYKDRNKYRHEREEPFRGGSSGSSSEDWFNEARRRRQRRTSSSTAPAPADWLRGAATKAEAKTRYRAEARKHHPDLGGSKEKFQRVEKEWSDFEKHHLHKLAFFMPGFFSELTRIHKA